MHTFFHNFSHLARSVQNDVPLEKPIDIYTCYMCICT